MNCWQKKESSSFSVFFRSVSYEIGLLGATDQTTISAHFRCVFAHFRCVFAHFRLIFAKRTIVSKFVVYCTYIYIYVYTGNVVEMYVWFIIK